MHRLALFAAAALLFVGMACASETPSPPSSPEVAQDVQTPDEDVAAEGWDTLATAFGERIYVPIYSHIFFRDGRRDIDLAATLSVRNADAENPIDVVAVRYYDSDGALVRRYLDAPLTVGPMASTAFLVEQADDTGGVGANFIVEWRADRAVMPPVVEAVMISAASSQGISFVTQGRVLQRADAPLSTHSLTTEPADPAAP